MFAVMAVATVMTLGAGVAIWYTVKPADAATVQPGAFTGYGFDACTAPSTDAMKAWKASPYRAVGIYIGGVDRGCAQPNLNAAWVNTQQADGWHLFPLYVGPQASCWTGTKVKIDNAQAAAQGRAAAGDAVTQAISLGLARNSTIIYDMEAYNTADVACRTGVLQFQSAWTIRLHELGYASGLYSSAGSGVADQIAQYNNLGYVRPDFINTARWDGVATTAEVSMPSNYWTPRRRMKQYSGGHPETYGGVTINIDSDYLDFAPLAPAQFSDFTGDGFGDIMARDVATGSLNLYVGHGGTIEGPRKIGSGWNTMNAIIRIGDLNRDGHEDILTRQTATGNLIFYPGTGSGFGAKKIIGSGWNSMGEIVGIGDWTRDGYPDLMAVQKSTGYLYMYPGRSGARLGTKIRVGTGWKGMTELTALGDFDRNGRPDMVARNPAGVLYFYSGRSVNFASRKLEAGWDTRRDLVGVGDFDRDGRLDMAAVGKADNILRIYRGNGTGFSGSFPVNLGFRTRTPLF
jgi:hypothetical protein